MVKENKKFGANGAVYYEKVKELETPILDPVKQVIPEFYVGEDYPPAVNISKSKKKKKKKVIQEVFADNEDL